ncbi:MAG TPA: SCO family protein [Acidothermaceae bacterium]|nr:SCO family protein [Acidothermaceae bacterium]
MRLSRPMIAGFGVVGLILVAAAIGQFAPSSPKRPSLSIGTTMNQPLPSSATSIEFTDDTGKQLTLGAFKGKAVMFAPFMTLCQETCPLETSNMQLLDKAVVKAHQENNVQMVLITIDPERDTVARLHAYRSVAEITQPNWTLLTAAPADLTAFWKSLGVDVEKTPEDNPPGIDWLTGQPLTYDVSHTDETFLLGKSGNERFLIDGMPNTQGVTPAPILDKFLSDEGRHDLAHPDGSTWTVADATTALAWVLGKHLPKA